MPVKNITQGQIKKSEPLRIVKREKQEQLWVESPSLEHTAPVCTALAENEDSTVEQQWAYCPDTGNSSNDAPNNEEAEPNLESDHPIKCYPCDPEYEQNGSDWDWTPLGASSTTTPTLIFISFCIVILVEEHNFFW